MAEPEPPKVEGGTDRTPDQEPFTEEDWSRATCAVKEHGDICDCQNASVCDETIAWAVLQVLAEAGRLLPPDGDVVQEWEVRSPKGRVSNDLSPSRDRALVEGLVAQWPGTSLVRREVRSWPDGSRWTGPWMVVEEVSGDG